MFPRTRFICVSSLCALLAAASFAFAHGPDQPAHQRFEEGDLKLESGEVIKDFAISYARTGS